ncbi:MAG: carboxymuconolactone decarboxylase family protein [Deinococcales bacterium]
MDRQRISYVDPATLEDPAMLEELQRCAREGTPRPESSAVRAHVPAVFWSFANSWRDVFKNGVCDHAIKELCRVYVSRSVKCEYCGNQRSMAAAKDGLAEEDYRALMEFESSSRYDDRQKAALSLAQAIAWHSDLTDEDWEQLHRHFSEPELVELGYFIGLTLGQQSFLRLLNIGHHEVLDLGDASLAPGFETKEAMAETRASEDYWARK